MIRRLSLVLLQLALLATPVAGQGLKADLQAARAHYSARNMTAAEQAALLNEVAWKNRTDGWGLLSKPDGNNCPLPTTGQRVSCDFLVFGPTGQGFDVLRDAEGAGEVTWDQKETFDRSRWVAPVGTEPPPPPIVVPPTPDPPDDFDTLEAIITALTAGLAANQAEVAHLREDLAVIKGQLDAIAMRPVTFPSYTGRVFGQPFTLTPNK